MNTTKNKTGLFLAGLMAAATLAMSGCNTIRGAGQDVESVGKTVEEAAQETEDAIN